MICVYNRAPEFASSNPLSLLGHGEVASMVGGMQMSTNSVCLLMSI